MYETPELTQPAVAASTAGSDAAVLGVVLAGLLVVVALAAIVAVSYRQAGAQKYQPVQQKEPAVQASTTNTATAQQANAEV